MNLEDLKKITTAIKNKADEIFAEANNENRDYVVFDCIEAINDYIIQIDALYGGPLRSQLSDRNNLIIESAAEWFNSSNGDNKSSVFSEDTVV